MFCLVRFWGWSENAREEAKDLAELSERARQGKPLYGESDQPEWVQTMAAGNSTFSALKFGRVTTLLSFSVSILSFLYKVPCRCTCLQAARLIILALD